ncbi:hypothetical protein N8J89_18440 [Crossiella sp. CA-258035]|uniref:hypothetical protein n=1 Tax=Crossiella sp. CA-258035 TaxID=2981138 RepID=UPI0024BCC498|nr:hypothetical protein [Crossiella sp. CA-258035]WHT22971.1 hypothetical protein N8J89_18440 [Crossiella sp. CA-258035]
MTEVSQSQLSQEAMRIALWEAPLPELDAATLSALSQLDDKDNTQAVGNKSGGDSSKLPELGPLEPEFKSWESVGSTIVHKAVALSGFNPGSEKFDPVAWEKFLNKFATIPFFLKYTLDYRDAAISKTSLKKAVDAVADLLENIMTKEDFKGIVETMKKIGQLALENEGRKQSNSNQQVGALSRHNGHLYLGAVRTRVEMEYKKSKGHEQLNQGLSVYRGYGDLDFDMCKSQSSKLKTWQRKNVEEWEKDGSSNGKKPNDSPAWDN